jgi:hypothetical protein
MDSSAPACPDQGFYDASSGKCLICPAPSKLDVARKECLTYNQAGTGGSEAVAGVSAAPAGVSVLEARPLAVKILGGVEGYTGSLSSQLDLGAAYGVALGWDGPGGFLGMELGYSGAAINLATPPVVSTAGANLYRNGVYFDLLPGIPLALNPERSTILRPYLLGGIGVDGYSSQTALGYLGYQTKAVGSLPFGAGVELRSGPLVADARFNWAWEMSSFTTAYSNPIRYQAQLSLGVAF